ncbi:cytochrome P450 family protein [Streptomyces rhizosphaericus]|uniref:cytochrome P450 family protein n=1 Tax=Streptomyces rhizosphaericus TaxID=114699 RepID=UPI000A36297F|nr:cytochrome P450 [Streptomyces rhizosphaericus]
MTDPTNMPQPFDAAFFKDPYSVYARLRAEKSVHHIALPDGSPIWLVTREADVRAGLHDLRLSVSKTHSRAGYKGFSLPPALDANLVNMEPSDHLRLRRLISKGFTPRHVEKLRGGVQETANQLADDLAKRLDTEGTADVVTGFANHLPITVIGDLLGVPEADRAPFADRVSQMVAPEHPSDVANAVDYLHRYLIDLVALRRARPDDNLLSALISVRDEGDRLSENELVSLAFILLMAGSENAQHLITSGLLTLLNHPDQLAAIRADWALLPSAVEELLRYAHPNHMAIRRFPVERIEIGGTSIPAGETVMLCLASANRDPDRYPNPDAFDILRQDVTSHLSLGQGLHYCLGASLARMEIGIALAVLLQRFPNIESVTPVDELPWRTSVRSRALKHLVVTSRP